MDSSIQRTKLFLISSLALTVTSMTFAIRAEIVTIWGPAYHLSAEQLGLIAGTAFWGFTLAQIIAGPLIDLLGMKHILYIAFLGHMAGIIVTIFSASFWPLYSGTLLIGIANGSVEAACNPLTATLYPEEKTKMLNRFHVWFPGGNVIGGVIAYLMIERLHLSWPWLMAILILPTLVYGYMFYTLKFPQTERVSSGVSYKSMLKACISPLFIFMVLCMLLTAATELGSEQWINLLLGNMGVSAILLLAFINGIMAIGRFFAGPIVRRLSNPGVLLLSAILAFSGLEWLSVSEGYMAFAAAFVFAAGVCYFWPTMLGFVAEYVPESGALGLNIMGGAGMLSVAFILPIMGHWYDVNHANALHQGMSNVTSKLMAGRLTLHTVAFIPLILIVAFTFLYIRYRKGPDKKLEVELEKA